MPNGDHTTIIGHVTRDPEMRYTQNGVAVVNFGIAVSRKVKESERTSFIDCKAWGGTAEGIAKHVRKGAAVIAQGFHDTESWDDKTTGQKRSKLVLTVEVFGLALYEKKQESSGQPDAAPARSTQPRQAAQKAADSNQDDVPF